MMSKEPMIYFVTMHENNIYMYNHFFHCISNLHIAPLVFLLPKKGNNIHVRPANSAYFPYFVYFGNNVYAHIDKSNKN